MMFWEWDLPVLGRLDIGVVSGQSSVCHCCLVSSLVLVIASVWVDILLSRVYQFHGLIYFYTIRFFVCYLFILFIFPFEFCLLSPINNYIELDNTVFWDRDLLVLSRLDVRVVSRQSSFCHCCLVSSSVWVIASEFVDILLSQFQDCWFLYVFITIGFFVCFLLIFKFPFAFPYR